MTGLTERSLALVDILRGLAADDALQLPVNGDCMAPRVHSGASVQVSGPRRIYLPGDVVVVLNGNRGLLVHRVIGGYWRHGVWKWLTQADAAGRPDNAVISACVVGKVAGGDCDPALVCIPLRHRLWAAGRFIRFLVQRLRRSAVA
jgi:hypothetical protein